MKILLVEDFEEKANNIIAFLNQVFPEYDIDRCSSYNTAQEMIFEHSEDYKLILLDMSMSTYDLNVDASGGLPEPAAGEYILEGMFLRDITTPVIVITMYNVFGRRELSAFDTELQAKYPQNYKSYVFYSSQRTDWKNELKKQIKDLQL